MTATFTREELRQRGMEIKDGMAVCIADAAPPPDDADITWQAMEARCRAVFEKAGCTVFSTSERKAVRRSPGVPDLLIFGPPGHPWHAAWETKSGRGKLSDAQRRFALHCQRTGFAFQCGGEYAARQFLKLMNSAVRTADGQENLSL